MTIQLKDIKIIQGGMGIRVSSWKLANTVSKMGQLGVVSGTAIDTVVARALQNGDPCGSVRRALDHFPIPEMSDWVKNKFFKKDGKEKDRPFMNVGMPDVQMNASKIKLLIVSNFVEVFLAKEGHDGLVGINYLEKIQIPTLPSLFGAMLAGVNVVLMGAGIPTAIPGIMDDLAEMNPVSLKLAVENSNDEVLTHFDPKEWLGGATPEVLRPAFLAIVSSDVIAKSIERKATGYVDGYVVENYDAGGHNAPPRRDRTQPADAKPYFGEKDNPNLDRIKALGKPYWLAGKYAREGKLSEALDQGASGIQVGTPFAFCQESGMREDVRREVVAQSVAGKLKVETSFTASPTGYPFKLVHLDGSPYSSEILATRTRVCDMGYLRSLSKDESGKLNWTCPAEPIEHYVQKGGKIEETEGRMCLCNGLASTAGLGQQRKYGKEPVLLTAGEDITELKRYLKPGEIKYSAKDVIEHLLSGVC